MFIYSCVFFYFKGDDHNFLNDPAQSLNLCYVQKDFMIRFLPALSLPFK